MRNQWSCLAFTQCSNSKLKCNIKSFRLRNLHRPILCRSNSIFFFANEGDLGRSQRMRLVERKSASGFSRSWCWQPARWRSGRTCRMWSAGSCRGWIKEASVSEAATRVYESSILHEYQQTAVAAIKTANAVAKKKSDGEDVKLLAWKVHHPASWMPTARDEVDWRLAGVGRFSSSIN